MAITQEKVFEAADRLKESGQNPTLAKVRKSLGGGSFTTISEHMSEWKSQQQTSHLSTHEPPPESITQQFSTLAAAIWAEAQAQANSQIAIERETLNKQKQQIEEESREAVELADQMSLELEKAQAQILKQNELLDRRQSELENAQQIAIASREDLARMQGELIATQEQNTVLLASLKQ